MVRAFVVACLLAGSLVTLEAQSVALRFYIVPKEELSFPAGAMVPKYIHGLADYSAMDYGRDNTYLVGTDVTAAQHTSIAANLDVVAIPAQLDNAIGLVALSTVQNRLESLRVPAGWVNENHTYRDVVRIVGKIFLLMQRFQGIFHINFWETGITLDTRMNQLTANQRTRLQQACETFNADLSNVTNTTTVRQVLKLCADQIPSFTLAGETF